MSAYTQRPNSLRHLAGFGSWLTFSLASLAAGFAMIPTSTAAPRYIAVQSACAETKPLLPVYAPHAQSYTPYSTAFTKNYSTSLSGGCTGAKHSSYIHQLLTRPSFVLDSFSVLIYGCNWHTAECQIGPTQLLSRFAFVPFASDAAHAAFTVPHVTRTALNTPVALSRTRKADTGASSALPISIKLELPSQTGFQPPKNWHARYHVGDILDEQIFNHARIIARMPRGLTRIRFDNVAIQLHEDSREITSISKTALQNTSTTNK